MKRTYSEEIAIKELEKLQEKLASWQNENFNPDDCRPEWMVVGALEELGEAAHILLKSRQRIRKYQNGFDDVAREDLKDAISDTIVFLMQLSTKTNISLGEALFDTAKKVLNRKWVVNTGVEIND